MNQRAVVMHRGHGDICQELEVIDPNGGRPKTLEEEWHGDDWVTSGDDLVTHGNPGSMFIDVIYRCYL